MFNFRRSKFQREIISVIINIIITEQIDAAIMVYEYNQGNPASKYKAVKKFYPDDGDDRFLRIPCSNLPDPAA
jgi:hypothetical protein